MHQKLCPKSKDTDTVYKETYQLQDEQDFATLGEAIRHMCQESGNNV